MVESIPCTAAADVVDRCAGSIVAHALVPLEFLVEAEDGALCGRAGHSHV